GQITYFNNMSRNFYAGGHNEVFDELGKINVQGLEMSLLAKLFHNGSHKLNFHGNVTLLQSKVLNGKLVDKDLFSQVVHNSATASEYIDKVNTNRKAYEIYVSDGNAGEIVLTDQTISIVDFRNITKA